LTHDKELPLCTIGTLCYNTGKYVIEALECVLKQNYPNIQHIIVDDCSTDDSVQEVQKWIEQNNYKCVFIKHQVNRGVHHGLREILDLAEGKYLSFISDDLWTDDKLLKQISLFEKLDESYAMIYGDSDLIDKDGNVMIKSMFEDYKGKGFIPPSGNIFTEVVKDFYFFIQASTIKLSHFRTIKSPFDKEIISEDWDWQLHLSRDFNILGINEIFAHYRWLETSIGRTQWTDQKKHNVWLSHAIMFLNYYNHPKNDMADRKLIMDRILRIYNELLHLPNFNRKHKIEVIRKMLFVTKSSRILILILKSIVFSFSSRFLLKSQLKKST
jgi:glycosyltransferase involved in cell wall biosynthesis